MEITNLDTNSYQDSLSYDVSDIPSFSAKDFYDDYLKSMKNASLISRNNFGDDSSQSLDIGSNYTIELSTEGSIGFIDKTISDIKNSGYTYSRMYYSTREPDYQIIVRRQVDLYCNNIQVNYNDTEVLIFAEYCSLTNRSNPYTFSTVFNRKNKSLSDIYISSSLKGTNNILLIGYKSYNRAVTEWKPQFSLVDNTVIDGSNHIIKVKHDVTLYHQEIQNYQPNIQKYETGIDNTFGTKNKVVNIKYLNYYVKTVNQNYNVAVNSLIDYEVIDSTAKKINFFIEGSDKDQNVYIDNKSFNCKGNILNHIYIERFKSCVLTSGEYRLLLNENTNMIRGYIEGKVSIDTTCYKTTSFKEKDIYIKCVRAKDYSFIGNYKITDKSYSIPNLNVVERYNLILIDPSGTLEPQVISDRQPIAYNILDYKIPNIVNQSIILNNTDIIMKINVDNQRLYENIKKIRLYYSNSKFTKETVNQVIYKELDNLKVNLKVDTKYNYYMFSIIGSLDVNYGKLIDISNISQITNHLIEIES